jgi:hypothetical protein
MKTPSIDVLQRIAFNTAITPHPLATTAATRILQGPLPQHPAIAVGGDGAGAAAVATIALLSAGLYLGFLGFSGYGMYKFAQDYVFKKK